MDKNKKYYDNLYQAREDYFNEKMERWLKISCTGMALIFIGIMVLAWFILN